MATPNSFGNVVGASLALEKYIRPAFIILTAFISLGGASLQAQTSAAKPIPFIAYDSIPDFHTPEIVLQYDPATKAGANWPEIGHPQPYESTDPVLMGRAADYLREGLKRMTGKEFSIVSKNDLSKGIVLTLMKDASENIRRDPDIQRALKENPKDLYAAKEAFYIRSEKDRVLLVANTPSGLLDAVVELLESVDYEILGMGPDWIHAPNDRNGRLVFALRRAGRPSYYVRGINAMGGQNWGSGTIMSGLNDPADETVTASFWRWIIGAHIVGTSMPNFPGHSLQAYHREVVQRMKSTGTTEGFLAAKTVIGPDAQRPAAGKENDDWLWINSEADGQPNANKIYISDGKTWKPQDVSELEWNLDLSVPFVRQIIFESMKTVAEASFKSHPNEPAIFPMEAEDGAFGNAMLDQRMKHKNWYPEYLAHEGIPFGKPYLLHNYKGLNQPNEIWDPAAASDNMFALANYLLHEFDKWIDSLPKDQQMTAGGKSKKELISCSFYSYNFHDVPPDFNPDRRIRVMIAGFPKHRHRGKWVKLETDEDVARAFKVMLPNQPGGDYRYLSNAYYNDRGASGIPASWSASPSVIAEDYRRSYDAGYRALDEETDYNFGKNGLGYYLISKMLWNANLTPKDLDAIRDRWFQRAFGSAAKEMKAYYDYMLPENFPVNGPNSWAKAIRLVDAADKKIDGAKEPDAQRRIDDVKQYWYYHYLMDGGKYTPASPEVKEYLWKGQMSYMVAMYPLAWRDFNSHEFIDKILPPEIRAGPAHYTHAETQAWWSKVLDFWKVTPVTLFADTTLSNGQPAKTADLNDLVEVEEFQSPATDAPFVYNSSYMTPPVILAVAREKDQLVGFKLVWPFDPPWTVPGDESYAAKKVPYGVDMWNPAQKAWEPLVDKTMTTQSSEPMTITKGAYGAVTKVQVVSVQLKAPRPGTYRFDLGRGGNAAQLASLAYDPVSGKYDGPANFSYISNAEGLTQSPVYFYIPKGTKHLDFEVWDQDGGKYLNIYQGLPDQKPVSSRKVDISGMGTHTIAVEPGEDGSIAMLSTNGFSFPYLYSIPTIWAKSPSALLVPRAIAEADGLTIVK